MSDRKTRDQHRRKFQELIDPENRSKRFRGEGNNKDDITPSSGIGITPSSGRDEITLSRRGKGNDDVITPTSSNENITLSALSGAVGTISKNFEGIRKHLEVVMFQLIILINTIIIIYNLY